MCLYEITRFLRETYQYMPKKVSNPSSYKFDMFPTGPGYPNSGGVSGRRIERSTKPVIGSVISNDSNNNSMITTTMIRPDMPSQSGTGIPGETRRAGVEISGVGHSSNDNISFADLNSDINLKHISFAINKDGMLKSHLKNALT